MVNAIRSQGGTVQARLTMALNAVCATVDAKALPRLAMLNVVTSINPLADYELGLSTTVPYLGAATLHRLGLDGAGVRVAVRYTGFANFIRVDFTTAPSAQVSTYFGSGTDIFWFAFDAADNLLAQDFSSPNTAPEPAGYQTVNTAGFDIRYVIIEGAPDFFVLDDVTYAVIPEPAAGTVVLGLGRWGWWQAWPTGGGGIDLEAQTSPWRGAPGFCAFLFLGLTVGRHRTLLLC